MNSCRTFALLKPAEHRIQETILRQLETAGFQVDLLRRTTLPPKLVEEYLAQHAGNPLCESTVDLASGSVLLLALKREDGQDPVCSLLELFGNPDVPYASGIYASRAGNAENDIGFFFGRAAQMN